MALMTGLVVLLSGCGTALPDYRYRLTVEVETPEGLKTGSSVIEVSTAMAGKNSIPTPGVISHRLRGEAVMVNLGRRGTLFALLRSDANSSWATNVLFRLAPKIPVVRDEDGNRDSVADFHARFQAMLDSRKVVVLPKTYPDQGHLRDDPARPMLVRFRDIIDPTTVERVDPDDLAASFGEGVKLRRITIQLTDDPITTGIIRTLPWLKHQRGGLIPVPNGKAIGDMPIGAQIHEGDFIRSAGR
jgi:hypothetical protein